MRYEGGSGEHLMFIAYHRSRRKAGGGGDEACWTSITAQINIRDASCTLLRLYGTLRSDLVWAWLIGRQGRSWRITRRRVFSSPFTARIR